MNRKASGTTKARSFRAMPKTFSVSSEQQSALRSWASATVQFNPKLPPAEQVRLVLNVAKSSFGPSRKEIARRIERFVENAVNKERRNRATSPISYQARKKN
ncbi:MAG: hypothetical protein ABIE23_02475 [archaeon]